MTENPAPHRILSWPSDQDSIEAFHSYTKAVGRVAYQANYLQERLGRLFAFLSGTNETIALSIWFSIRNDRQQRQMLSAVVAAGHIDGWKRSWPKAEKHINWLVDKANKISDRRDNAVHAPCSLTVGRRDDGRPEMAATFFSANPRAKNLRDKDLLVEFSAVEEYLERLSYFAIAILRCLESASSSWPDIPELPNLQGKKSHQDQRRPPSQE